MSIQSKTRKCNHPPDQLALPARVAETIDRMAARAPRTGIDAERAYLAARDTISRAIGWDAPLGSSRLYELAIGRYIAEAGL